MRSVLQPPVHPEAGEHVRSASGGFQIRMLGPFEVARNGVPIAITSGRQRALLAALAVRGPRGASSDELASLLWGNTAPHGARTTIRGYVLRLRRLLDGGEAEPGSVIEAAGHRYRLGVAPEDVDHSRFRELIGRAGRQGDRSGEARLLRQALGLWRGPALSDVACVALQREVVPALNEMRLDALHRLNELALSRGEAAELIPALSDVVAAHPLEERFWAQLLRALYAAGRPAAVLTRFAEFRQVINERLGVEPGPQVREVFERVLAEDRGAAGDPGEDAPPEPGRDRAVPRQLPPHAEPFTGRADALAELDGLVGQARRDSRCVLVSGPAGAGKTAFAVHWAHRAIHRFPDGQFYVDLNGFGPGDPLDAARALRVLLLGAGIPAERVPAETSARSAQLRTLLAGKRALLVLDNAHSAEQVRPLLPGGAATVLVTSRSRLRGLVARDGAARIWLGRLTEGEAGRLLSELLGADRCAQQARTLAELVLLSERLPLTLRIMAERAGRHPHWPLSHLVAEIRAVPRISAFDTGEDRTGLHAVLARSYDVLTPGAARLFRLLGQHDPRGIEPVSAVRLLQVPTGAAVRLLDELADVNLIEHTAPERYEMDAICRSFAAELAARER